MAMTLDELKEKNRAEEEGTPEEENLEVEPEEEPEEEPEAEEPEEDEPGEDDPAEEPEVAWMTTGDKEPDTVPLGAHTKMRSKLKAKVGGLEQENQELKATVERLSQPQAAQQNLAAPKRDDFDYGAGGDADYAEALAHYVFAKKGTSDAASKQAESHQRFREAQETQLEAHDERAKKLTQESGITQEAYLQADMAVRSAIEAVMPQQGDLVTDQLISTMGEGSEKVFYFLGRNPGEMQTVQSALRDDPSGIKAAMLVGRLHAKITSPHTKRSSTPKPAKKVSGGNEKPANPSKLQKQYREAHKKNDGQRAFDIRRKAKKEGVDVSAW